MLQERGELAAAAKLGSELGLSSRNEIGAEAAEAAAAVAAAKVQQAMAEAMGAAAPAAEACARRPSARARALRAELGRSADLLAGLGLHGAAREVRLAPNPNPNPDPDPDPDPNPNPNSCMQTKPAGSSTCCSAAR